MTRIRELQEGFRETATILGKEVERRKLLDKRLARDKKGFCAVINPERRAVVVIDVRRRVTLPPRDLADRLEGSRRRVLVADNEILIREVVKDMLEVLGFGVALASNGHETIRKCREAKEKGNPFDVVIMDLTIRGGLSGTEILRELRAIDSSLKVIASSAHPLDPVMENFENYGFADGLAKPYHVGDLEKALKRVLAFN